MSALANQLRAALDQDDAIALLRGAIGRESVTGNEANFVSYLADQMRARGIGNVETSDFLPGRPNVWGTRKGVARASACSLSATLTPSMSKAGASTGPAISGKTLLAHLLSMVKSGAAVRAISRPAFAPALPR